MDDSLNDSWLIVEKTDIGKSIDNYKSFDHEALEQLAASHNCELIVAGQDQLVIDLDTPESIEQFNTMIPFVSANYMCERIEEWKSKSGKGEHRLITLELLLPRATKVALQTILGSDPKLELLNLKDIETGNSLPFCLFKPIL